MRPEPGGAAAPGALVDDIHASVLADHPERGADLPHVLHHVRRAHPLLPRADAMAVARAVAARVSGLGPLEPLLADDAVTEVMVNGQGSVWVERVGELDRTPIELAPAEVDLLVERIVGPLGLRADRTSPIADARLPDGSRVNVVVPPLAVDGPCITIRRFGARRIPLGALCPPGVEDLLAWCVRARSNVIVSGGTGAGKTTVLNALGALLPDGERVVTVEDTAELHLAATHVVRLEARPASADGVGATSIRQLVRNALRMRPDRIIVGEVRGPEAADMLWAMNTGHEGSLSTCHANSPLDALRRLEVMVLSAGLDLPMPAVRDQLTSTLDLVVQVARTRGGRRSVVAVAEVIDPPPADGPRVRLLAGPTGLHDLPLRAPRRARGPAARRRVVSVTARLAGVVAAALVLASTRPGPARLPDGTPPTTPRAFSRAWLVDALDRARPSVRRRRRDRQLPDALDRLASSFRAGEAVGPALVGLAHEVPDPLGAELRALAGLIEHGAPVADALAVWSRSEEATVDVQIVAAALTIGARAGGEVARAVDGVAATLRERHELRAEVRALATQARASAAVLAGAPVGFAVLVAAVEPRAVAFLLTTPVGLACLIGGIGLDALGVLWMARITRSAG